MGEINKRGKTPFPLTVLFLGSECFLTDIGISFLGLFITFYVAQQPAELLAVDGVRVRFCGGKAP